MADDDRRVDPRPMGFTGGQAATAEGIAALDRRRLEVERQARTPPATPFSAVLAQKTSKNAPSPAAKPKAKTAPLPKTPADPSLPAKGPVPGLQHPAHRFSYGRDPDGKNPIILKG